MSWYFIVGLIIANALLLATNLCELVRLRKQSRTLEKHYYEEWCRRFDKAVMNEVNSIGKDI